MKKYLRRIVITVTLILISYSLLGVYIDYKLKQLIVKQVEKFSSQQYKLEIGKIKSSLWAFNAEIEGLKLRKIKLSHSPIAQYYFDLSASHVKLKKLNLIDLLFRSNFQLQKLIIEHPSITLNYNDTIISEKMSDSSFYKYYYELNQVVLKDAKINVIKSSGEQFILAINHLDYSLKDMHLYTDIINIEGINCVNYNFDYRCQINQASLNGFDLNELLNRMQFKYSSCNIASVEMQMKAHSLLIASNKNKPSMLQKLKSVSGGPLHPLKINHLHFSFQSKYDFMEVSANDLNYAAKQLNLKQINLRLKQKHLTESNIASITIEGFDADQLITQKHCGIKKITVNKPHFKSSLKEQLTYIKSIKNTDDHIGYSIDQVETLTINSGSFTLIDKSQENFLMNISGIDLNIKDFNPLYFYEPYNTMPIKQIQFKTGKVDLNFPSNLYRMCWQQTAYSFSEKKLQIDSLKIIPNFDEKTFYRKIKKQIAIIHLGIKQLSLNAFDINKLVTENKLSGNHLAAHQLQVNFYKDKNIPLAEKDYKRFPQELIYAIPYPFHINKITMKEAQLKSEILNKGAGKVAAITIDQINSTFENVDNKRHPENKLKVMFEGRLAGAGVLRLNAMFDMYAKDFKHRIHAEIGSMPLNKLNDFMFDFASFEIKSGELDKAMIDIRGNNKKIYCDLFLAYHDLSMNLLKNQNRRHKRYKNIASVLANSVIYKNNPEPGKKARFSTTEHIYESNKFIVGNWITASFKALLITTVPKAAEALQFVNLRQQKDSIAAEKTPKWLKRFLKKKRLK